MPSLKAIRKRKTTVQSTQKITRAMKMVAGARLSRAQLRITELRPYAVKVQQVLWEITRDVEQAAAEGGNGPGEAAIETLSHPLLVKRPESRVLMVVLTSDRGLCGAFNATINKRAEREWRDRTAQGQDVQIVVIGRKGRDYLTRRQAPLREYLPGVWDKLDMESARRVGGQILGPFLRGEVDAIYLVYNEFKSAMSQNVVVERLLPSGGPASTTAEAGPAHDAPAEFIFEPNKEALLERLAPMYVDISILRALYESMASELGARMTAMDAATKNATEMIEALTLQYNKARQAAITKELMEIIGGSEALKD
ncbi:ATP synthase F1 subunit gamma [Chondromyces crocatus]|uniref:ATP synthase gamma chain n=1 Tax=Chondromyces crocatus TaxID=52 RepID=A0A0K1ETU4_CHOCO|nr:ATP synthase F1 subunit gamma [Chondromyces crocatus]AKT44219.1 F0F1 ATP synthase subunit gamma [Chondromyces crocatus]